MKTQVRIELALRRLFGFRHLALTFALSAALAVGCSGGDTGGNGGSGGHGGAGGTGGDGGSPGTASCVENICPCTEAGIRAAISEGGGPFTFDCDGPRTVVTEAEIVIDNDVELDGAGDLTVSGGNEHRVFSVPSGVTAVISGFVITAGDASGSDQWRGSGILNEGRLELSGSTVKDSNPSSVRSTMGIYSTGALVVRNSTVSGHDGGIGGYASLINSTVSGNGLGIVGNGTVINSTVWGNADADIGGYGWVVANSIFGRCLLTRDDKVESLGGNIESPGETCELDQMADQVNVDTADLKLGELTDNGGPTETHALGEGGVAVDAVPAEDCVDADGEPLTTDQRGEPRPAGDGCDVGAVEVQP